MTEKGTKRLLWGLLLAATFMASDGRRAAAGETSATNFPVGVNTALSAVYPPAGATEFYNYNLFYTAGKFVSDSANPAPSSFRTNVFVEAFRINHTWVNITPDITFGSGFAINFVHQDLRVPGVKANLDFGFADPDIIPYNIGFHVSPNLWIAHIFNIFPSWGSYEKSKVLNPGLGYTTYAPELALTYTPTPAWEISLDARVGFNTRNNSTKYQSSNDFTVDYVAGYRPVPNLPALQIGLNGYYYKQIADDYQNNVKVGNGNRGQVFGIGPSIRYDIGHGGLILKWQHELAVENRTKGDRIWFQFAVPL